MIIKWLLKFIGFQNIMVSVFEKEKNWFVL